MDTIVRRSISRFKAVQNRVGLSRATICRRIRRGEFPRPVDLGGGLLGFYDDEIDEVVNNLRRVTPKHGRSQAEAAESAA